MSNIIKKYFNIIIALFILIQPIIDLITGLSLHICNLNITLGIIIRIIFLNLFQQIYYQNYLYIKTKNY